jgi:DNA-binding LytR/AlgR family response regulator
MMDAFECNGIDYLLKPFSKEDITKALKKYKMLEKHFTVDRTEDVASHLIHYINSRKRTRVLVRKGVENITMLLSEIVLFFTENKVVHAIDKNGKKFMVDKTLADLEIELDKKTFFRANRQYILNIDYIKSYKPYDRVKLWVELNVKGIEHVIVISQETAPWFRKWMLEA